MLEETTTLMVTGTETSLSWRRNKNIVCVSCTHFVQILAKQSSVLLDIHETRNLIITSTSLNFQSVKRRNSEITNYSSGSYT